jgi:hypothetical protein
MELDGETPGRQTDAEVGLPGQSSVGREKCLLCPRVDEVFARCGRGSPGRSGWWVRRGQFVVAPPHTIPH